MDLRPEVLTIHLAAATEVHSIHGRKTSYLLSLIVKNKMIIKTKNNEWHAKHH